MPARAGSHWKIIAITALSSLGIVISVYLSISHYSGNGLSCVQDAGCSIVASSNYAIMFNVPISVLGILNYTGILSLSFIALIATPQFKLYALLGSVLLTVAGLIFSLYLTALSIWVITAYCLWCLASLAATIGLCPVCISALLAQDPKSPLTPMGDRIGQDEYHRP